MSRRLQDDLFDRPRKTISIQVQGQGYLLVTPRIASSGHGGA